MPGSAGIAPPALPGISSIRRQPAGEAAEANLAAPAEGTDPEPDRPSDPQPMRGPSDQ